MFYLRNIWRNILVTVHLSSNSVTHLWPISGWFRNSWPHHQLLRLQFAKHSGMAAGRWLITRYIHSDTVQLRSLKEYFLDIFGIGPFCLDTFHTLSIHFSIVFSGFSQRRRHPRGPRCQDPWRCCRVWEMTRSSRNPSIYQASQRSWKSEHFKFLHSS